MFKPINTAWRLNMGPVGCPEMSVTKYQTTQRKLKKKTADLIYTGRKSESMDYVKILQGMKGR